MPEISVEDAAREILKRRRARETLLDFTKYTMPSYRPAPHHETIANLYDELMTGVCDRAMVFVGPRHGKSELLSRRGPAHAIGSVPDLSVVAASYNSELATDFGREVKSIVESDLYRNLFDTTLRQDSKAANRWATTGGGQYFAVGVGSGLTGRGMHLGIIDDPFKDRQDADSETQRQRVWDWYRSTFYTRLMPYFDPVTGQKVHDGAILLINTRWHEDDLSGRILNSKGADRWKIIDLPAIENEHTDHETALWEDQFPLSVLHDIRDEIGPREWSALYQQKPQPDEGIYFQRDWIQWYDPGEQPAGMNMYGASDFAVIDGKGDYTEHGILGVDEFENIYITDWWYDQVTADVWIDTLLDMADQHKPLVWLGEAGVIRRSIEPFLSKRMTERSVYQHVEWIASVRDKTTRARSIQSRASNRKIFLPRNTPWADRLLGQMLMFPAGKHDDAVDVLSLFGMALDKTLGGVVAKAHATIRKDRYDRAFEAAEDTGSNWKTA